MPSFSPHMGRAAIPRPTRWSAGWRRRSAPHRLFDEVAVAFHQGEPGFDTVLDELTAEEVTVVPVMTSAGHYSEVVLPEALARNRRFADVRLRQTPPVGTHPGLRRARRPAGERAAAGPRIRSRDDVRCCCSATARRDIRQSRDATLALAETLRRRRVAGEVRGRHSSTTSRRWTTRCTRRRFGACSCCRSSSAAGRTRRRTFPRRWHRRADRPVAGVRRAVGALPGIVDLIVDLARRHPPPPPTFRPRGPASCRGPRAPCISSAPARAIPA